MKMPRSLAIGIVLSVLAGASRAQAKVEEQVAGPLGAGLTYVVSPKGAHLATVTMKGSRAIVVVDGVAGPKFDQMLAPDGTPFSAQAGVFKDATYGPVVFSPGGERFLYATQQGNEIVCILDGKEVARMPMTSGAFSYGRLQFSPQGKHWLYLRNDLPAESGQLLAIDGQAVRLAPTTLPPANPEGMVFSHDEARYAFVSRPIGPKQLPTLVVDGADAGYPGLRPRFSADGKYVLSTLRSDKDERLLVDGQAGIRAQTIASFHVPPTGNRVASVLVSSGPDGLSKQFLVVDGKKAEDTTCQSIRSVVHSPDGKRWAAACTNASGQGEWVVVDGKKGELYSSIPYPEAIRFTADSSLCVYVARNHGKDFVVVGDEESDACQSIYQQPVVAPVGARYAYTDFDTAASSMKTVVDGKVVGTFANVGPVLFSADGAHYAATFGTREGGIWVSGYLVDGEKKPGFAATRLLVAPVGGHVALFGQRTVDSKQGLFLDGELVYAAESNAQVVREAFTPDGNHLCWLATERAQPGGSLAPVLYVDGKEIARFDPPPIQGFLDAPETWSMEPDGVLHVLGSRGGSMQRLRVTPDPASDLASVLAEAAAKQPAAK